MAWEMRVDDAVLLIVQGNNIMGGHRPNKALHTTPVNVALTVSPRTLVLVVFAFGSE